MFVGYHSHAGDFKRIEDETRGYFHRHTNPKSSCSSIRVTAGMAVVIHSPFSKVPRPGKSIPVKATEPAQRRFFGRTR